MNTIEDRIAVLLHDYDPMRTCCKVNLDMEDEYVSVTKTLMRLHSEGVPLRLALLQTFDSWFWPGCLQEQDREVTLDMLVSLIDQELSKSHSEGECEHVPILHREFFDRFFWLAWTPFNPAKPYADFIEQMPEHADPSVFEEPVLTEEEIRARLDADDYLEVDQLSFKDIPWLHNLFFEKVMRRLPSEKRMNYEELKQCLQRQLS